MATPSAVVLTPTGEIASRVAIGAQAISELGQQFSREPTTIELPVHQGVNRERTGPGSMMHRFELRDLDREIFGSADIAGKSTLVLNPTVRIAQA